MSDEFVSQGGATDTAGYCATHDRPYAYPYSCPECERARGMAYAAGLGGPELRTPPSQGQRPRQAPEEQKPTWIEAIPLFTEAEVEQILLAEGVADEGEDSPLVYEAPDPQDLTRQARFVDRDWFAILSLLAFIALASIAFCTVMLTFRAPRLTWLWWPSGSVAISLTMRAIWRKGTKLP